MRLESIDLVGWMPFKEQVQLTLPAGPIAIVGTHAGDTRRSNRSGKTAFLEAITWCLFGVHRKRLDDQIINSQSELCSVTVGLGEMLIARGRQRGESTKLRVKLHGKEATGQKAQEMILEYVGLQLDDYLATLCFRQGDVESIINRTPGERLALVSEWLQQSRWLDAKKIQGAKVSAADQQLATKREVLGLSRAHVLTDGLRVAMVNEIERLHAQMAEIRKETTELSEQIAASSELRVQVRKANELAALRVEVQELRTKRESPAQARQELEAVEQELQAASASVSSTADELENLRRVVDEGFDGECPVMCAACPVADKVTQEVRESRALYDQRVKAWALAKEKQGVIRERNARAKARLHQIDQTTWRYQEIVRRGKELSASITATDEELDDVPDIAPLQAKQEQLQASYLKASNRVRELETTLEASKTMEVKCEGLEKEAKEAETQSQVARLAYRAISSVPARIAFEQLGELEQEANLLLAGAGVSLRFSWARELADKTPICDECAYVFQSKRQDECPVCKAARGKKLAQELELLCSDGSVEEDVRYNSGGTRAIVGSAIRLAASAMLRRLRSTQAAWAIVDEPFGSLDAENREGLASTFSGMLGSVGFEQALVVSHDPQLLSALPHRIVVDKDGAASTLKVE